MSNSNDISFRIDSSTNETIITIAADGTIICNKKYAADELARKFLEALPEAVEMIKSQAVIDHLEEMYGYKM